tara:strand:- start:1373 stop:1618 length:246 start_codon:yes stop_codon:yes gene_type:complete
MRGITMWKGTEEELEKIRESRHNTEMMYLERKEDILKDIDGLYNADLENDMTLLKKDDWILNFFMEMYIAVNMLSSMEESK